MADDSSQVPAPDTSSLLDRGAMERVLARASELASGAADAPDGMSEAQLFEIGKEVGLTPSSIQQALAEERTRVVLTEETGLEARVMGPAAVSAVRSVPHSLEATLSAVDEWMRSDYRMLAKRRFGNRRTWEQRQGIFAELERGLRGNQAAATLMKATEVAVTVSPFGGGRTAVRLDADISQLRRGRKIGGIAAAVTGFLLAIVPMAIGALVAPQAMLPLALTLGWIPIGGLAVAWATLTGHRKQASRAQLALEQLLDRLEHGPLPRSALPGGGAPLLSETINAVAAGVREVAKAVQDATATKRGAR